jgi:hypothetical protein
LVSGLEHLFICAVNFWTCTCAGVNGEVTYAAPDPWVAHADVTVTASFWGDEQHLPSSSVAEVHVAPKLGTTTIALGAGVLFLFLLLWAGRRRKGK